MTPRGYSKAPPQPQARMHAMRDFWVLHDMTRHDMPPKKKKGRKARESRARNGQQIIDRYGR
jgi:hypothetical protein